MEDTLREFRCLLKACVATVLILVLMEDTLREIMTNLKDLASKSLNPCFNGRYSQRIKLNTTNPETLEVLILVLMEDTLRVRVERRWRNSR